MRPDQYIGVTGFTCQEEVKKALAAVPATCRAKIMIGVLASDKSLAGIPNKYPHRYPSAEKLKDVFVEDSRALNVLHIHTKGEDGLLNTISEAYQLAGPLCHGVQLNICWPGIRSVAAFRRLHQPKVIVLQCGMQAIERVGRNPTNLANRLGQYAPYIDYVLVDESGGAGKEMDVSFVCSCFREIRQIMPEVGLVASGGLDPADLSPLEEVLRQHPDASVDIEGRVRDVNDYLVIPQVKKFIVRTSSFMQIERAA